MLKHFTFVFHEIDPHLPCVVINETLAILAFVFVVHISEWIISKGLELTWVVWTGNGCLAYFPNWHASQTSDITSSVPNLGRPLTRFCFSINLRRWRLTWPIHLCQIPMSLTPFPCVNNMEFTLDMFTSKVNIRPFFSPLVINLP